MITKEKLYKKYLRDLTTSVSNYLTKLDGVMKWPSSVDRGKEIARLSNWLEIKNDEARFFGLGINYRKDRKKTVEESETKTGPAPRTKAIP